MRNRFESLFAGIVGAGLMALMLSPLISKAEASYIPVPTGGIIYFATGSACPAGWTEYTGAPGRYIVNRTTAGAFGATAIAGTALTTATEDRPVGQHSHTNSQATTTASQGTHVHTNSVTTWQQTFATPGAGTEASGFTTVTSTSAASAGAITVTNGAVTVNNSGTVAGTNAPYIQLLACSKS